MSLERKSILNLSGEALIRELCLAVGPSGLEDAVRDMIRERAQRVCSHASVDTLGNLICKMSFGDTSASGRTKIMLSAHMDEVGFMIDGITSDGMLTFGCVGGIDAAVLAGRKVLVCSDGGVIRGVICSKAIHHKDSSEREAPPKADKLYIDIGADGRERASELVRIGDLGTFDAEFFSFGKGGRTLKGRALDDRMGCAALLEIMDKLKEAPIERDVDVYFCFTVREEIGYSGASAAALAISPDLAVVLEATAISDVPETPAHRRVADVCGGVVVSVADKSTLYDRATVDLVLSLADEKGIKAQIKRYVSGGNDAGHIHKTASGIRVIALSVPTRYLHSPACVAHIDDYIAQRDLALEVIKEYKRG